MSIPDGLLAEAAMQDIVNTDSISLRKLPSILCLIQKVWQISM